MKLPKELTTVTPLSKYFAMVLFISLPFIGFLLGIKYQETVSLQTSQSENIIVTTKRSPTPEINQVTNTSNWKIYTNKSFSYEILYPQDWIIKRYIQLPLGNDSLVGFNPNDNKIRAGDEIDISIEKDQTVEKRIQFYKNIKTLKSITDIIVAKIPAKKIETKNSLGENLTVVLFSKDNYLFSINSKPTYSSIFDQILSTFRFAD